MSAPPPSNKDAPQVLRYAFDDATGTLRTTAILEPGGADLEIHYTDDSIAIGDPATDNILGITANNEAKVDLTAVGGSPITLGQKVSANSIPVVLSSDQSPITVVGTITGSPNVNIHDSAGNSLTSTAGSLNVDVTNTVPISAASLPLPTGASTSALQTTGNASLTSIDSKLTSPITVTANQGTSPWVTSVSNFPATQPVSGTVAVTQSTSPWVDNITQFGSNPVVTGTGASGVGIPRVTVSNDSNILATQSGPWTVTANAGTNLNTSALALDASVTALQVSQSSTTSGEKGPLVQGAVTTAAPTYTTGQTNPISLTTSGALRTDSSGSTQPISGTVTAKLAAPTAGTVTQAARTIGTTATRATVTGSAPSATRTVLAITADAASTAKFYIGSSSVTNTGATAGIQFDSTQPVIFSNDAADYYIISDTAGQTVYFMEQA